MGKFVYFKKDESNLGNILVNLESIVHAENNGGKSRLTLSTGKTLDVIEDLNKVERLLNC